MNGVKFQSFLDKVFSVHCFRFSLEAIDVTISHVGVRLTNFHPSSDAKSIRTTPFVKQPSGVIYVINQVNEYYLSNLRNVITVQKMDILWGCDF